MILCGFASVGAARLGPDRRSDLKTCVLPPGASPARAVADHRVADLGADRQPRSMLRSARLGGWHSVTNFGPVPIPSPSRSTVAIASGWLNRAGPPQDTTARIALPRGQLSFMTASTTRSKASTRHPVGHPRIGRSKPRRNTVRATGPYEELIVAVGRTRGAVEASSSLTEVHPVDP